LYGIIETIEIDRDKFERQARLIDDANGSRLRRPNGAKVRARDLHGVSNQVA
jgi:hypothetical protein